MPIQGSGGFRGEAAKQGPITGDSGTRLFSCSGQRSTWKAKFFEDWSKLSREEQQQKTAEARRSTQEKRQAAAVAAAEGGPGSKSDRTPFGLGDDTWPLRSSLVDDFEMEFNSPESAQKVMDLWGLDSAASDLVGEDGSWRSRVSSVAVMQSVLGEEVDEKSLLDHPDLVAALSQLGQNAPELRQSCPEVHPGFCKRCDEAHADAYNIIVAAVAAVSRKLKDPEKLRWTYVLSFKCRNRGASPAKSTFVLMCGGKLLPTLPIFIGLNLDRDPITRENTVAFYKHRDLAFPVNAALMSVQSPLDKRIIPAFCMGTELAAQLARVSNDWEICSMHQAGVAAGPNTIEVVGVQTTFGWTSTLGAPKKKASAKVEVGGAAAAADVMASAGASHGIGKAPDWGTLMPALVDDDDCHEDSKGA